jgi:hypothetical protein
MTLSLYGLQVCQGDDANRKLSSHDIKNQKLIQTVGKLIYVNMYTCMFVCISDICIGIYVYVYMYICICIYIYVYMYLKTCICIHVCVYICITACHLYALQLITSMTHY